ncbi:MAG TPA: LamG-like jellyroll fold domain-containing protein [Planctomycetota bacterium]|nr:LamG-like jellyroll fold domain-containing protein [Planctomycetota bacterium]
MPVLPAFSFAAALVLAAATAQDTPRVLTNRPAGRELLKLPKEEDAFGFVVYGDRTGGPAEGIEVLKQAVADTNLLDPDLVLTVGDLVNGYNANAAWQAQAAEYKAAMGKLRMPWFPVAGNHDIYWRGPNKPAGEHERNFETVFGPLWYAVQHKKCWFVVLYSDEGNPATGEKDFNKPECQRMSDAQFTWLSETLQKAKGARHVFVFLHHPRWLKQYGTDWDRVHALLAKNGNVTAVFAGHIHRMRYDGTKDGIQYYTVASVGAFLEFEAPAAGYLHQFHVVTVRPQGITVAALPVGTVMDPQQITGQLSEDVDRVHERLKPAIESCVAAGSGQPVRSDGSVDAVVTLRCENPATRAIELELVPSTDGGWVFGPDHQHLVVAPGKSGTTTFAVRRSADPALPFGLPMLQVRCDYLAADRRIPLPRREFVLELPPPADLGMQSAAREGALVLDGVAACLQVGAQQLPLPDGPFTLEAWLRGKDFKGRRGLLAKTESSEYALFGTDGVPEFVVWLGDRYATAVRKEPPLVVGKWHHLAGVYDGSSVRLYVDGALAAEVEAKGKRKTNGLPLFIGADPNKSSAPVSFFSGAMDEVRLSKVARYKGPSFAPPRRHEPDADTLLLLHLDSDFGPWTPDASPQKAHPTRRGTAHCTVEAPPLAR